MKDNTQECCSRQTRTLDGDSGNTTYGCDVCQDAFLVLKDGTKITLPSFLLRRRHRPLNDRDFAVKLIVCCQVGAWPSPAVAADFGILNGAHFETIRELVEQGRLDAYVLDRVLGSGTAITELVAALGDEKTPIFKTPYDLFYGRYEPRIRFVELKEDD